MVALGAEAVLNVMVSGGGPVGLAFALLLEHLMGCQVAVTVYDERWTRDGARVRWKDAGQGNSRRQQVVTIQSRRFLGLPREVQERLFRGDSYSEMWPAGADSIRGHGPRNVRIADLEDRLLELANEKPGRIRVVPARFHPAAQRENLARAGVLAICEASVPCSSGSPTTAVHSHRRPRNCSPRTSRPCSTVWRPGTARRSPGS
jgi:2-polyprenyl-6-methoxyphenol hydroxylase-like FAD-dependent oxidoreductase